MKYHYVSATKQINNFLAADSFADIKSTQTHKSKLAITAADLRSVHNLLLILKLLWLCKIEIL